MKLKTRLVFAFTLMFQCISLMLSADASSTEQTLAIVKPDAVAANHIGDIIAHYEKSGLQIAALRMVKLSKTEAEQFYQEHKERPFYGDLVTFMTSGPVVAMVLQGKDAVVRNREQIGSTDPAEAAPNTIRAKFAQSKGKNAVHGSDSLESAKREIGFFFKPDQIFAR